MSHKAKITDEKKLDKVVRIEYEVVIDGGKINYPDLDGKVLEGHFDIDYKKYKDNSIVDKHLKTWADEKIEEAIEKHDPTESAKGRKVEL